MKRPGRGIGFRGRPGKTVRHIIVSICGADLQTSSWWWLMTLFFILKMISSFFEITWSENQLITDLCICINLYLMTDLHTSVDKIIISMPANLSSCLPSSFLNVPIIRGTKACLINVRMRIIPNQPHIPLVHNSLHWYHIWEYNQPGLQVLPPIWIGSGPV